MAKLNRSKLQRLAKTRLDDARALLRIRRFGAAYYFAGYVVELGLKACIARQTRRFDFPERQSPRDDSNLYTHNLANLLKL
ncbi:MAG: HEPN domain-containing protein, partial [Planctomycetes bacterium]|nr:HEPN domain-containing protein [Planctomycetota bacterium]